MEATMQKEVKDYMAEYYARMRDRQNKALKEVKEQLAPKYIKNNVTMIELHYSGCGDSGEMTEVAAYDKDNNVITDYSEKGKYLQLHDDWSEICYDLLTYDWYNNDGGGGVIYIDLENEIRMSGGDKNGRGYKDIVNHLFTNLVVKKMII